MSVAASDAWKARRQGRGNAFRRPSLQPGAMGKIEARVEEFQARGWTDRELYDPDERDLLHGHHGLAWWLQPDQAIGHIGRWWIELVGPPDGNGVRSHLFYPRQRLAEMLASNPGAESEISTELRRVS